MICGHGAFHFSVLLLRFSRCVLSFKIFNFVLQEIVDNCILDRYNPYTGETEECAEIDTNITQTCYDYYDADLGATSIISITVVVLTFIVALVF